MFCRGPAGRVCSRKGVVWVGEYGALARVNLTDPAVSLALEGKKFRGVRMRVGLPCGLQCVSGPQSLLFIGRAASRSAQLFPF